MRPVPRCRVWGASAHSAATTVLDVGETPATLTSGPRQITCMGGKTATKPESVTFRGLLAARSPDLVGRLRHVAVPLVVVSLAFAVGGAVLVVLGVDPPRDSQPCSEGPWEAVLR